MFESILSEFDAAFPKKQRDKGLPQGQSASPEKRRRAGLMQGHGAPGVSATSAPKGNWRSDDQAKSDAASTKPHASPSTIRKAWRTGDSQGGQHSIPQGVTNPDKVAARSPGQAITRAKARKADAAKQGEKPEASYTGTKLPGFRKREWADKAQWQQDRAKQAARQGAKQESFFSHEFVLYESMQEGVLARAGKAIKRAFSGKPKDTPAAASEPAKAKSRLPHETRNHDIHNAMRFRGPTKGAAGRAHAHKAVKHFDDMAAQSRSRGTEHGSDHQWFKTASKMMSYGRNMD